MTSQIKILPENLCNKIAAGEVVERPASVVKELLENSIDADARDITIEIEKGGKKLIRLVDDGCGMDRDDIFLCLERHATSKISSADDLFKLQTLGFRGEALPSIAAVSRMVLRSRPPQCEAGMELLLDGGEVKRADVCGMAPGTSVEVRDLFYRLPARRKFLRRDETELAHVGEVVTRTALAHPDIQFRLLHHGRSLIDVRRAEGLRARVANLLGRHLASDLVEIDAAGPDCHIHGLIGPPQTNRATSGTIYTFVNGRYIRDRVVQHAVLDGYRTLLPRGRYPVVVLFLELDPEQVDVNVHPTKHEVRFRQQSRVHDFIVAGLADALRESSWVSPADPGPTPDADAPGPGAVLAMPEKTPPPSGAGRQAEIRESLQRYVQTPSPPMDSRSVFALPSAPAAETVEADVGFFSGLRLIGQYHNSYLLCQDGPDLLLIDQHAAHERVGFERLRAQWRQGGIERQSLLFPPVLEFSHLEQCRLQENLEKLGRLGFELEPFGGNAFVLKAVPQLLSGSDAEQLVRDVAAELAGLGSSSLIEEALDKVLILMACHRMVRANQALTEAQIRALLKDLDSIDFSAQCPHGRPVMHRLSLAEVEKFFHRG
ncbi:DNA mismatch repair protein MutL [Geothermobacter hydrogeniphilus]|uniref:DNA mismatch repair protein MutL n=1 Tax=Geothermobacter hydrogeniphilus TaxID=1969733 RepID=A0A2K2HCD0_9BACT|nr:DNA mismatch repair endonuclease MutL [Geothermobacter hydrogeniphilus]PNU20956.1 DNA mismatch repair protein MutL [Geothermobacter hydrogeniphilus]